MEIAGMVEDSKYRDIRETTPDYVYVTMSARATLNTTLLIRADGNANMLVAPVRELMSSLSSSIALENVETLREQIDESLHQDRIAAALCGVFSGLALLLTTVGLFGLMLLSVARRTSEIGLRMALGAQRGDVLRLVAQDGMRLVFGGLAIGAAGAAVVIALLKGMLFQVKPADPLALGGVAALLIVAGLLACYLPARRATRIDPMQALRSE
jgi:putative ABC transport system permease protein